MLYLATLVLLRLFGCGVMRWRSDQVSLRLLSLCFIFFKLCDSSSHCNLAQFGIHGEKSEVLCVEVRLPPVNEVDLLLNLSWMLLLLDGPNSLEVFAHEGCELRLWHDHLLRNMTAVTGEVHLDIPLLLHLAQLYVFGTIVRKQ